MSEAVESLKRLRQRGVDAGDDFLVELVDRTIYQMENPIGARELWEKVLREYEERSTS